MQNPIIPIACILCHVTMDILYQLHQLRLQPGVHSLLLYSDTFFTASDITNAGMVGGSYFAQSEEFVDAKLCHQCGVSSVCCLLLDTDGSRDGNVTWRIWGFRSMELLRSWVKQACATIDSFSHRWCMVHQLKAGVQVKLMCSQFSMEV